MDRLEAYPTAYFFLPTYLALQPTLWPRSPVASHHLFKVLSGGFPARLRVFPYEQIGGI
jgi:hypothetical protein